MHAPLNIPRAVLWALAQKLKFTAVEKLPTPVCLHDQNWAVYGSVNTTKNLNTSTKIN